MKTLEALKNIIDHINKNQNTELLKDFVNDEIDCLTIEITYLSDDKHIQFTQDNEEGLIQYIEKYDLIGDSSK